VTRIPALIRPRENGDPVAQLSRQWAEQIAADFAEVVGIAPWSPHAGSPVAGDDRLGALITSHEQGTDWYVVPVWTYVAACEWVPGRLEIHVQVYGNNTGGRSRDFMAVDGVAPIVEWVRALMPDVVKEIDVPRSARVAMATGSDGQCPARVPTADDASRLFAQRMRMINFSILVGGASTIGGLIVAAILRPQSPDLVWLAATITIAALSGATAGIVSARRRRARRQG
jgi:hypothetical protein